MNRPDELGRLAAAAGAIAGEGTDPELLAAVVAWAVRPRRSPDALRRACRERSHDGEPSAVLAEVTRDAVVADDARAARAIVDTWAGSHVRVAVIGDRSYPGRLAAGWPVIDAPLWLAWRGAPPGDGPAVALVGARQASGYGTAVTAWLAEAAALAGINVVSGGAVGIDASAHRAAMEHLGGTTVVLGCGHTVDYPRPHARPDGLFDRVLEHGGSLVSELLPGEPPRAGQVRARNRIVAGLADAVVVVEGAARSGALLTAGAAAERGRGVLAVPGDVRAPGSAAPHRLLAEGAAPCTQPDDLLAVVAAATPVPQGDAVTAAAADDAPATTNLPADVAEALRAAWPRPLRLEQLAERSGVPVPVVLAAVTRARVAGEVAEGLDGIRLRRRPPPR